MLEAMGPKIHEELYDYPKQEAILLEMVNLLQFHFYPRIPRSILQGKDSFGKKKPL